jgi:hypothetical protein
MFLGFLGFFCCLLFLLFPSSLFPRHIYNFSLLLYSLGMQPALSWGQQGYCFLCSHWLSLSPLIDNSHSPSSSLIVPFRLGLAYIRQDSLCIFHSAYYPFLLFLPWFTLSQHYNPEDVFFIVIVVKTSKPTKNIF